MCEGSCQGGTTDPALKTGWGFNMTSQILIVFTGTWGVVPTVLSQHDRFQSRGRYRSAPCYTSQLLFIAAVPHLNNTWSKKFKTAMAHGEVIPFTSLLSLFFSAVLEVFVNIALVHLFLERHSSTPELLKPVLRERKILGELM